MRGQTYCTYCGKVCFDKRADAERVLRGMRCNPARRHVGSGVYRCEMGGNSFHITHQHYVRKHRMKADAMRKVEGRA